MLKIASECLQDDEQQIGEILLDHCEPFSFSEPWDWLPPSRDIVRLPASAQRLLAAMRRQKLSPDALCRWGLIERVTPAKKSKFQMCHPGELLVVRRNAAGQIAGLLTERGDAWTGELAVLSAVTVDELGLLPEEFFPQAIIAFSIEDVAVLRNCGIPATVAAGLEHLAAPELDRFCELFQLSPTLTARQLDALPPPEVDTTPTPLSYDDWLRVRSETPAKIEEEEQEAEAVPVASFVNWSVAALNEQPPAAYSAVDSHLRVLQRFFRIQLHDFGVWSPSAEWFARLRFLCSLKDLTAVREHFWDGLFEDMQQFDPVRPIPLPDDFATAIRLLHQVNFSDPAPNDKRPSAEALKGLVLQLFSEQILAPAIDDALSRGDPRQRAVQLLKCELLLSSYGQILDIVGTTGDAPNDPPRLPHESRQPGSPPQAPEPKLKLLQRVAALEKTLATYMGLDQEIDKCRTPTVQLIAAYESQPRLTFRPSTASD